MDPTDPMEADNPMDGRRCTAHNRSGKCCRNRPIRGGNVCRLHGGGAPQVKKAAKARLDALVDPSIGVYDYALKQKKVNLPAALKAASEVLNRTRHKEPDKLDVFQTNVTVDLNNLRERINGMTNVGPSAPIA